MMFLDVYVCVVLGGEAAYTAKGTNQSECESMFVSVCV